MPTRADDTVKKEALYPDDLEGRLLEIDSSRLNGELVLWSADEDGDDLPDGCRYGWWLPVEDLGKFGELDDPYGEVWAAMPRAIRQKLLDLGAEPGERFVVEQIEKGPGDTDDYHAAVVIVDDD